MNSSCDVDCDCVDACVSDCIVDCWADRNSGCGCGDSGCGCMVGWDCVVVFVCSVGLA